MSYFITRTFELTEEELFAIRKEEHKKDVAYDVETEVDNGVDDGWLSFEDWTESGCEYASAKDARYDFIDKLVEDILEREYIYERDPYGYRYDLTDRVIEFATDMGYFREENLP